MTQPYISIVIPVHNEQECLETLYQRLTHTLDAVGKPFEIILINDGSRDRSEQILNDMHARRPQQIRVIHFNGNYGQHMAIMAGFERVRGEIIITMDADLQNPPEDIPKLIAAMEQGHDVVSTYRMDRQDKRWRKWVSSTHNKIRALLIPRIQMRDQGCMLRAYHRRIVDMMASCQEASTFIPALALNYAANPTEVGVRHEAREAGESSYNLYRLIRYNFDLVTGFSLAPLELFTLFGVTVSGLSFLFVMYLFIRRIFIGPEAEGVFTLFAILFFLVSCGLLGLGIIGEYIGRIYQEVRSRPRFMIRNILEAATSTENREQHTPEEVQ